MTADDAVDDAVLEQELGPLKPLGSSWPIVCWITRGPAKPTSALGSAKMTSPSIAKLAATPPVVGCSTTETYGSARSRRRPRAADVLAICISESTPSCMRAPPDAENTTAGRSSSTARSNTRVTFSPTTEPIEPPMNSNAKKPTDTGTPSISPRPERNASVDPLPRTARSRRSR